jgi:hypothetical protein
LGSDDRQKRKPLSVVASGRRREDDEVLQLVFCGEDLTVEGENTDVRVDDTFLQIGSEADVMALPQLGELWAATVKRVEETSGFLVVGCSA